MKITPQLLEKYYKGLCTPQETNAVEQWQLNMDADEEDISTHIYNNNEILQDEIWQQLSKAIKKDDSAIKSSTLRPSFTKTGGINYKTWLGIAACLAVICGLAVTVRQIVNIQKHTADVAYKIIKTAKGQKANVTLPDGTMIMVNSESQLKYPIRFTDTSRVVYLTGEAYFKVAKDASKPFSIYTATTHTRVLGTIFNINAYPGNPVTLAVEEGKVAFGSVNTTGAHNIYTANQMGAYSLNATLTKVSANANIFTGWKTNKLVFTGESLAQIVPVLERWYNVSIIINSRDLKQDSFTGEFYNPSIHFLLSRMGFVMKFNYTINNRTININKP